MRVHITQLHVILQISLQLPKKMKLNLSAEIATLWEVIAENMYVPFDYNRTYHPEYQNYRFGRLFSLLITKYTSNL